MPTKITTAQPSQVRRPIQLAITDTNQTVAQPPYFSVPARDGITPADPADSDRVLLPGEIFFGAPILVVNTTSTARTVNVEMVSADGSTVTSIAPGLTVPANDVLTLPPGLSLVTAGFANPASPTGMLMRVRASASGALQLTTTIVEREWIQHDPAAV